MKYLQNSNELIALFGNIKSSGYENTINLTDTKVGFSVQRNYPKNIRFKPAKTSKGIDDNVAVIWVVYESLAETNKSKLIPIRLRIGSISRYRITHWDYNFDDEKCPTRESVETSKKSVQPLEFNLINEFFYDAKKGILTNSKSKKVKGLDILNLLFNYHCDSTHPIKGLRVRTQNYLESTISKIFTSFILFLKWALIQIFGRTIDEQRNRNSYFDGYLFEDFKKTSDNSLELGGYKTSKRVILLFAILVSIFTIFKLPVNDDSYFGNLLKSDFLLAVHALIGLYVLDELIPNIIFYLMNKIIYVRKVYLNYLLKR